MQVHECKFLEQESFKTDTTADTKYNRSVFFNQGSAESKGWLNGIQGFRQTESINGN